MVESFNSIVDHLYVANAIYITQHLVNFQFYSRSSDLFVIVQFYSRSVLSVNIYVMGVFKRGSGF